MNRPSSHAVQVDTCEAVISNARPKRIGIFILIMTFGIFGLWSVAAPLKSAALAPGKVAVNGQRRSIEHLEGGLVASIAVRDGDYVSAGDMLLQLDKTQSGAQLEITRGQFYATAAKAARLKSERDDANRIDFPDSLTSDKDQRALEAMLSQTQLFEANRSARLGEIEILQQKIEQLFEQATGTEALLDAKRSLKISFEEEILDFSQLVADGFVDKQHLRELRRSLALTQGELAEHSASLAQQKIEIGETRLQVLQLEKNFRSAVIENLGETETELYDLAERQRAAADRERRTTILTPVSGVVVAMSVTTIGEVVKPGEPLLYIVPQNEQLIVQAQLSPIDIDRVQKGQAADIRFSAFRSASTPVIEGTVTSVSADALADEQRGNSYYLARVELTPEGQQMLDGLTLVPGMPVEVLINTGSHTLYRYLTQPIRNAFARSLIED